MEFLAKKEGDLCKAHVPLLNPVLLELCRDASWHPFWTFTVGGNRQIVLAFNQQSKPNLRAASILRAFFWI